jgi:hypothetical protein
MFAELYLKLYFLLHQYKFLRVTSFTSMLDTSVSVYEYSRNERMDRICRVFLKELYNGNPNVTVWRMLRKRLHLKVHKLFIAQRLERWTVLTSLSVNSFVTLAIQLHLVYRLRKNRYNFKQGVLEKSKLAQHAYKEGHRVIWNEARIL